MADVDLKLSIRIRSPKMNCVKSPIFESLRRWILISPWQELAKITYAKRILKKTSQRSKAKFSPEGDLIATSIWPRFGASSVKVTNTCSRYLIFGHRTSIFILLFSPGNKLLSSLHEETIHKKFLKFKTKPDNTYSNDVSHVSWWSTWLNFKAASTSLLALMTPNPNRWLYSRPAALRYQPVLASKPSELEVWTTRCCMSRQVNFGLQSGFNWYPYGRLLME